MIKINKIISRIIIFSLFFFIAAPHAGASSASYQKTKEAAREAVWKVITSGQGSSATVAVMDGGKIIYSEGFGAADRKAGNGVDKSTRFNIGSTSKMFVATAILLLVDDGRVSLDDPVVKYIPEFEMKDQRYRDIKVRMLFNHSSGLPGSTFFFEYEPEGDPHRMLLERMKDSNLKHDPGVASIYCNDGFTLAEIIVERVSGQKFPDFLEKRIFKPLGMKDTKMSIGEAEGNISNFYDPDTGKKYPAEVILVHAAGGLSSTAEDLCRFADSFCKGGKNILSKRSLEEILKSQPTPFSSQLRGPAILDSFGWDYSSLPAYAEKGVMVFAKGGGTGAYSTGLQVIPEKRLAVAASMSGRLNGESVTRPVLNALMKDKGLPVPLVTETRKPMVPEAVPQELTAYEGIYVNGESFIRIKFDRDNKKMDLIPMIPDGTSSSEKGTDAPIMSFVYNGGSFFSFKNDRQGYFIKDAENLYFIAEKDPFYGIDTLMFQSVPKQEEPKKLFVDLNGKLWLMRNLPHSVQFYRETPMVRSATYSDLPGYLHFINPMKVCDANHATYAAPLFRDQSELYIYESDGEVWAESGIYIFSQADMTKVLVSGQNSVIIGKKGYNEWFRTENGAVLSFDKPAGGRVMLVTEEPGKPLLYDSIVDENDVYAPEGSYVICIGKPGDIFTVYVK